MRALRRAVKKLLTFNVFPFCFTAADYGVVGKLRNWLLLASDVKTVESFNEKYVNLYSPTRLA